jgi:hypothetical protein
MSDRQPMAHTCFVKAMQAGKKLTSNMGFFTSFVAVLVVRTIVIFHRIKAIKTNDASILLISIFPLDQA